MYGTVRFSIMQPNYSSVVQHEQIVFLQSYDIASHKLMKNWFGLSGVHITSVVGDENVAVVLYTLM